MKTVIYYFSGTGNSLYVARMLAERLGECDVIPLMKYVDEDTVCVEADRIGFVFPNYFAGMPPFVRSFMAKLEIKGKPYIFAVPTSAGVKGYALRHALEILAKKGQTLSYGRLVPIVGNYILPWYYEVANKSEKGKEKAFRKAVKLIDLVVADIKVSKVWIEKMTMYDVFVSPRVQKYIQSVDYQSWDQDYHINEKCNGCQTCVKACPVGNVSFKESGPVWNRGCELCMACIQLCPAAAIQYRDVTEARKRYRHPEVAVKDLINIRRKK